MAPHGQPLITRRFGVSATKRKKTREQGSPHWLSGFNPNPPNIGRPSDRYISRRMSRRKQLEILKNRRLQSINATDDQEMTATETPSVTNSPVPPSSRGRGVRARAPMREGQGRIGRGRIASSESRRGGRGSLIAVAEDANNCEEEVANHKGGDGFGYPREQPDHPWQQPRQHQQQQQQQQQQHQEINGRSNNEEEYREEDVTEEELSETTEKKKPKWVRQRWKEDQFAQKILYAETRNDWEKAYDWYERHRDLHPPSYTVYDPLMRVLARRQEWTMALRVFKEMKEVKLWPKPLHYAGLIYAGEGHENKRLVKALFLEMKEASFPPRDVVDGLAVFFRDRRNSLAKRIEKEEKNKMVDKDKELLAARQFMRHGAEIARLTYGKIKQLPKAEQIRLEKRGITSKLVRLVNRTERAHWGGLYRIPTGYTLGNLVLGVNKTGFYRDGVQFSKDDIGTKS